MESRSVGDFPDELFALLAQCRTKLAEIFESMHLVQQRNEIGIVLKELMDSIQKEPYTMTNRAEREHNQVHPTVIRVRKGAWMTNDIQ